jgi:hypothetical protein
MNLFNITPVGAYMDAIEAAARSDCQAARRDIEHGRVPAPIPARFTPKLRAAVLWAVDLATACHRAFMLRLAPRRHQ